MKRLHFQDNKEFYKKLKKIISDGEKFEIVTDFTSYDQVPADLKNIFELEEHKDASWVDMTSGLLILGATSQVGFNPKPLYVLGGAGAGAGIGFLAGGPFGAAVGGAIGMAAGTLAAMSVDAGEIEVEVDTNGKLKIRSKR